MLDREIELLDKKIELLNILYKCKSNKLFKISSIKNKSTLKEWIKIEREKAKDNRFIVATISNKQGIIPQTEYFKGNSIASLNTKNYYVLKKKWFVYNPPLELMLVLLI